MELMLSRRLQIATLLMWGDAFLFFLECSYDATALILRRQLRLATLLMQKHWRKEISFLSEVRRWGQGPVVALQYVLCYAEMRMKGRFRMWEMKGIKKMWCLAACAAIPCNRSERGKQRLKWISSFGRRLDHQIFRAGASAAWWKRCNCYLTSFPNMP